MHLDLSTCAALKAAGMPWEPKQGDRYYFLQQDGAFYINIPYSDSNVRKTGTWIPRLDDFLALIEAEGWEYSLNSIKGEYFISIGKREHGCLLNETYRDNSPESAAAAAYLWILQTKNKEG